MTSRRNSGEAVLLDRPLTPRSIVASLLLGTHPPRLPSSLLVEWAQAFGIAEGTTRVALSRMVAAGELRAVGGTYGLAGRLQARQETQDWSLAPELRPWRGLWRLGIVTADHRSPADRQALRAAATRARLAELRPGAWGRPDNLPPEAVATPDQAVLDSQLRWWTGRPDGDAEALVLRIFPLDEWSARADALHRRLVTLTPSLPAGDIALLADGFVVGAAALQHIRRDPLLPRSLAGQDWPGAALRRAYRAYQPAFTAGLGAWRQDRSGTSG